MILSDSEIIREIDQKNIVIEPFRPGAMGSNSYDVHLGKTLAIYDVDILDAKAKNQVGYFDIRLEGFVLMPDQLYWGVTEEYTETYRHVLFLEEKSSGGRWVIDIHETAGKGDIGFKNYWTLEI